MNAFINTVNAKLTGKLESAINERNARIAALLQMDESELFDSIPTIDNATRKAEQTRRASNTCVWVSKDTTDSMTFIMVERAVKDGKTGMVMNDWYNVKRVILTVNPDGDIVRETVNNLYIRKNVNGFIPVTDKRGLTAKEQAAAILAVQKADKRTSENNGQYGYGFNELTNTLKAIRESAARLNRQIVNANK
jgi:hypothetical protein